MADPRPRSGRGTVLATALAIGLLAVGCGGDPAASATSAAQGSAAHASPPALPTTAAATADPDTPLVVDAGLLDLLPASVAGVAMRPAPDVAAGMIGDADLARTASAVAVGVVIAAGNSRGDDFASSSVVQLRPGVYSDDFYRDWRAAYDQAACAPAGGVASHAQYLIGSHTVEVTVCRQGARTYQTVLPGDRLVAITAVGDRGFGDLVIRGLRQ